MARIVTIIGSGETTPGLAKVHRALLARLAPDDGPPVVLDTPYGFQENADELTERTLAYFRDRTGRAFGVASLRRADVDPLTRATAIARIREAGLVFSGPGSPSYALRQWAATEIPLLLAEKLARGGIVVFASAAALTLGAFTIPVYEIYKVGESPRWLAGLDLLGPAAGLRVAVVPHFDNTEGGTHDTRFCYVGERRLRILEEALPPDAFILGVDGQTALLLDLDAGVASVQGRGAVTVRVRGRSEVFPSGTTTTIAALQAAAVQLGAGAPQPAPQLGASPTAQEPPLAVAIAGALRTHDPRLLATRLLEAEEYLVGDDERGGPDGASGGKGQALSGEERAALRDALRTGIVRLAELAAAGGDRRNLLAPFVDLLLELRSRARADHDWATADEIRQRLVAIGLQIHDREDGTDWDLPEDDPLSATATPRP
jgi:hypothetical protein